MFDNMQDGMIFVALFMIIIILVTIQSTLNKILKTLNDLKVKKTREESDRARGLDIRGRD